MPDCKVMFSELLNRGGLSLDRLRNFMLMAEAGSIAKAAPENPTRQSQISRQIRELEEFFGVELTHRRGKTLALSPAGERLKVLITGQLRDLEDFRRDQAGEPKSFTIGAGASTLEWMVTPALPRIRHLLGGATLRTESLRSRSLVDAVRDGRVDFAILRDNAVPDGGPSRRIMDLSFHLCVPRRLLKRGTTAAALRDPESWASLPFAAGRDGGQTDAAIRASMEENGIVFRPHFECISMLQVRHLVSLGHCAAILPSLGIAGLEAGKTVIVPFAPLADYGRSLRLHWNQRQMSRRDISKEILHSIARDLSAS